VSGKLRIARISFLILTILISTVISLPAYAQEEEIGLVQRLWRKFFKKETVEKTTEKKESAEEVTEEKELTIEVTEKKKPAKKEATEPAIIVEDDGATPEEIEELQMHARDLEDQKELRQILERIKRDKEAQDKPPHPSH